MIFLALFLLLPALIEGCGKRPAGSRVINGDNAAPHSWPWQISLRKIGKRGPYHICGGTLVSPDWVVTASHCIVKEQDPKAYTVVVGGHYRKGTTGIEKKLSIKKLIVHPDFPGKRGLKHDIALIQLSRPVTLTNKINVACLPTKHVKEGAKCYITGWGRTEKGSSAEILQQAILRPVSQEACRKIWLVEYGPHLCAGEGRAGATGGCNGDSGGPLVCEENGRWVLHGAVSFGMKWCPTTHYTVFARVYSYIDWIRGHMGLGPMPTGGPTPPNTPPLPDTTPLPPQPTTPSPGGCTDKWGSRCQMYKGYCFRDWVKNACKKTCKYC